MKSIITGLILSVIFLGCSSKATEDKNIVPKLVVGKTLSSITLNDQFGKSHTLSPDTYKIVFVFAKDSAHVCNDFFKTQKPTYLKEHHTVFIADVSAAPSLIRSMFIMPGLKDLKHTVLLIEDKNVAAPYKKGLDINKIAVVYILNKEIKEIKEIKSISTAKELQKIIEENSAMDYIAPVINKVLN
jgi:hypothetical protein